MRKSIRCLVVLSALSGVLLLASESFAQQQTAPPPERSRTQGLKETDRFVKAGDDTAQSVANAKLQIQKTLDAYNALVTQPSKDMKGDYKRLLKSVDTMNDRLTEAKGKVELMKQAAEEYFTGRAAGIKSIQDQDLQTRAKQRLSDSQKEFDGVLQSLRETAQSLEPLRKELGDQITYIGNDLTPSAMASLKPNADKLNGRGKEVFGTTDKAVSTATTYFKSIRAAQSS